MPSEFFDLSLSVQTALGSGYLGYMIAYAGFRSHHKSMDTFFISLVFSSISYLVFFQLSDWNNVVRCATSVLFVVLAAIIWRKVGRSFCFWVMQFFKVHNEDGNFSAWDVIVQTKKEVGQCSVHLKDGSVLYLDDRRNFSDAPWEGLYLGSDGSVILAVESEEPSEGKIEKRQGVSDPNWGTRMTFIPSSEIQRVNIRMK